MTQRVSNWRATWEVLPEILIKLVVELVQREKGLLGDAGARAVEISWRRAWRVVHIYRFPQLCRRASRWERLREDREYFRVARSDNGREQIAGTDLALRTIDRAPEHFSGALIGEFVRIQCAALE